MLFLKYLLYSAHLSAPGNARLHCPQAQDNAEVSDKRAGSILPLIRL